ncbi:MAG: ATP-binding protein [Treponema sp.]|nr:ATP-binding protein [Treponema sp.]
MEVKRRLVRAINRDFEDIEAVFINGARQTGKSTLAESFGKAGFAGQPAGSKVRYINFDDLSQRSAEIAAPGQAFADIEEGLVILDEIQLVPASFLALKQRIDKLRRGKTEVKFLLTGSADIMLIPRLAEALVGRMYVRTLYPFSAAEILNKPGAFVESMFRGAPDTGRQYSKVDINSIIARTSFPKLSLEIKNRGPWFENYLTILFERDIRNFSDIDRLDLFPRLLSILASRTGGLINDANLSGALKLSQPTIKRYRTLLNGVFLTFLLPPWFANLEKRLVKTPKIYFTDTMLLCHLLGMEPQEIEKKQNPLYGFVLENFVAGELTKEISLLDGLKLYFFRTGDRKEVDFIVQDRQGRILAIELKSSASAVAEDFKHLRYLKELVPGSFVRGVLLYRGTQVIGFGKDLYAVPVSALWEM